MSDNPFPKDSVFKQMETLLNDPNFKAGVVERTEAIKQTVTDAHTAGRKEANQQLQSYLEQIESALLRNDNRDALNLVHDAQDYLHYS